MRNRTARAAAALLASLAFLACDGSTWLHLHHVASFREVGLDEARHIAAEPHAHLLQTLSPRGHAVPGAEVLGPGQEQAWAPSPQEDGPVVILAGDSKDAYRLAARLARAGIQDVAVYAGDLGAWREPQVGEAEEVAATHAGSKSHNQGKTQRQ